MEHISFAARIKLARAEKGWTLQKLSVEAGVGLPTLVSMEKGRGNPHASKILAVAKALDIPPAELFALSDQEQPA
jgi:transcriptional regulator with XRE-family HTH domain